MHKSKFSRKKITKISLENQSLMNNKGNFNIKSFILRKIKRCKINLDKDFKLSIKTMSSTIISMKDCNKSKKTYTKNLILFCKRKEQLIMLIKGNQLEQVMRHTFKGQKKHFLRIFIREHQMLRENKSCYSRIRKGN